MPGHRIVAIAALAVLAAPLAARAQAPHDSARTEALCWTARQAPRCRVMLLTNLGVYADLVQAGGSSNPRLTEDAGLMVNVSPRDAVGVTVLFTATTEGYLSGGPTLHYRRWVNGVNAWDFALGVRGAVRGSDQGAVTGLIRYNFGPYFAVALRPEYVRSDPSPGCRPVGPGGGGCGAGGGLRLSAGFEIGSWPSVAVALVAGLIGGMVAITNPPRF